jgi:tetratricopeptide (TPR) repeat protein
LFDGIGPTVDEETAADAEFWNRRGIASQRLGDLPSALADYDQALSLRPDYVEALHNRATARHQANDLFGAAADFDRAIALAPDSALLYDHRAYFHYCCWEHARAVADYSRAIELDDSAAPDVRCRLHLYRGDAQFHAGRSDLALDDYRQAFRLNAPLAGQLLVDRLVRDVRADLARVLADCAAHLRKDPGDAIGHARRGLIRLLQGRDDEARHDFEFFFGACPGDRTSLEVIIATAMSATRPVSSRD